MSEGKLTAVILQPGYLPWLGFFDQMRRSDIFIYYDDVQFDERGWRHRNRIKLPTGPHWLTVPVRHQGRQRILEVEIDNSVPWAYKHLSTVRHFYAHALYLNSYLPDLEELLERRWELIADLDIALIELMCSWLGLHRRTVRSSMLGIEGERSRRLLELCLHFGASRYLSGDAARGYLDVELFQSHGVEVEWQNYRHPVYEQQHGAFIPYLSTLDLLLNCGDDSAAILSGGGTERSRR
jgi:hypothetical protein